uniref:Uncharacterized protein n=1 Tax=Tetranychus urticae TaxID=32264 RepID=T1K735_TETUR
MIKMFEAKNSCNDECLTKTYCISNDGSGVCSENNLVTARFSVIPVFGKYDYLQITLTGYNVASDDAKTIKVSIDKPSFASNIYTCYKSSNGSTGARYDRGAYSLTTGSSDYMDDVLNCTWTFNIGDSIWPLGIDLMKDSLQSVKLHSDSREVAVARDTSQLPIYHAQYVKCCNKVHGDDSFLLAFDQTEKQILYRLYYWKDIMKNELTITLTSKYGIVLQFVCSFRTLDVEGYIGDGNKRFDLDKQIIKPYVYYDDMCSWATPFVLSTIKIGIDASISVFNLQVQVDGRIVYIEKDVRLKNI